MRGHPHLSKRKSPRWRQPPEDMAITGWSDDMADATCKVEDCGNPVRCKALCGLHYERWRTRGTTDAPERLTVVERFWTYVDKTESCWVWTGGKTCGYGAFHSGTVQGRARVVGAHRFSYELTNGPISPGFEIDHMCFNRACVNPDHLRQVTRKQNREHLQGPMKNNRSSGVRGVSRMKNGKRPWRVVLVHNKRHHYFGVYATVAEAEVVAIQKRAELFSHAD